MSGTTPSKVYSDSQKTNKKEESKEQFRPASPMIDSASQQSREKVTIESASDIYNVSNGQKISFYKRMQMTNGNNYQQSLNSQN